MNTNNQHTKIKSLVNAYPLIEKITTPLTMLVSLSLPFLNMYQVLVCGVSHTSCSTTSKRSLPDPLSAWAMFLCFVHTSQTQKLLCFLCHSSTFGWINSQYYIVWYQTPAVVQHQKGRCMIHKRVGDVSVLRTQQQ